MAQAPVPGRQPIQLGTAQLPPGYAPRTPVIADPFFQAATAEAFENNPHIWRALAPAGLKAFGVAMTFAQVILP